MSRTGCESIPYFVTNRTTRSRNPSTSSIRWPLGADGSTSVGVYGRGAMEQSGCRTMAGAPIAALAKVQPRLRAEAAQQRDILVSPMTSGIADPALCVRGEKWKGGQS